MNLIDICDRIIRSCFYFLFILTPFLFNPSRTFPSFELFEWNKMIFVYCLTVIVVTAWVVKMITARKFIFHRTPLFWPLILLLTVQIIATVFSIDPHLSIWGYYSRFHGGLLSTIAYTTLYFAFVSNLTFLNLQHFLFLLLTAASLVSLYGIAQRLGIDKDKWVQDVQNRVFSTLGQPNWLAAYLAILFPISLNQLLSSSKNFKQSPDNFMQRAKVTLGGLWSNLSAGKTGWYYLMIGILLYVCLLFTKSRSGFLGFWGANIVFWLMMFLAKRFTFYAKRIFLVLHLSFFIVNFFIRTPFSQYNRLATIDLFSHPANIEKPQIPVGDSVINVGITDSSEIRKIVWRGALDIIKNYPLFGTGPETFAFAYYRFRPAAHNLTSEWDFLYNRAHNEFLNIAATTGLIGLATYLLLILVIFVELFQQTKQRRGSTQMLFAAFIASYVSILVTNFFGFSVVVVGLFFFLLPVLIFINIDKPPTRLITNLATWSNLSFGRKLGIGISLWLMLFFLINIGRLWIADSIYAKAISYSRAGELDLAYPKIVTATNLRPDEPNFHDQRADIAGNYAAALMSTDATRSAQLFQDALLQSNQALTISPQNVNFWKTRTRILFALSEIDETYLHQALNALQLAMELAPTDPKLTYNAAVIYGRLNHPEDAIKSLQKTIELKGDYRDAYIALSIFYIEQKDITKAKEILNLALQRINPNDEEIKQRLEEIDK